MNILDEIDILSKIGINDPFVYEDIYLFMQQFAERAVNFLQIERINIWLLNKEKDAIYSIAEYDKRYHSFRHHSWIYEKDVPHYFQHLKENKIILVPNIHTHPATYEFSGNYAKEYDVISLMDIPMRLNGKLIGVMCFEKTGNVPREFNEQEQVFALALSQLAIAHIENIKRKNLQMKLEQSLKEKELMIKELNHRVKNNFSVLVSLLRLSKQHKKDTDELFENIEHQIFSMIKVHELLLESGQYDNVCLNEYLKKLCDEFAVSYPNLKDCFWFKITNEKFDISAKHSIHLGIIITEIFLNSLKYCLLREYSCHNTITSHFELSMEVTPQGKAKIIVGDGCNQFDFDYTFNTHSSLGLSIIKDLAETSGFEIQYPQKGNSKYCIMISSL